MNRIVHGDCIKVMGAMDADSVDLVVTSPPYDDLRAYNGYEFDAEAVLAELLRVVKPGGVVVWVVADQFKNGSRTLTSFRQAIAAQEMGWRIHDHMIWRKGNPCFEGQGRYTNCFENMFVFSKGRPKTFNGLREPCTRAGRTTTGNYEKIGGEAGRAPPKKMVVKKDRLRRNIWDYGLGGNNATKSAVKEVHTAIFPEQLAVDHIRTWSNPGDLVLDPFAGSGTTCVAAKRLGRSCIGIDISEEYCRLAEERLAAELL